MRPAQLVACHRGSLSQEKSVHAYSQKHTKAI